MFTKRVTVLLNRETHSMLVTIAKRENTTISVLIRKAINEVYGKEAKNKI